MALCEICGRAKPRVRNRVCKQFAPRECSAPAGEERRKREAERLRKKRKNAAYLARENESNRKRMNDFRSCAMNQRQRMDRERARLIERDATEPGFRADRLAKKREYSNSPRGKAVKAKWRAENADKIREYQRRRKKVF
jgi:hypothetical protein